MRDRFPEKEGAVVNEHPPGACKDGAAFFQPSLRQAMNRSEGMSPKGSAAPVPMTVLSGSRLLRRPKTV